MNHPSKNLTTFLIFLLFCKVNKSLNHHATKFTSIFLSLSLPPFLRNHNIIWKSYYKLQIYRTVLQYGDLVPPIPWLGAGHAEDLNFVFGVPFIDELYNIKGHNMTDEENALSVKFMEFWTNFAKSGYVFCDLLAMKYYDSVHNL